MLRSLVLLLLLLNLGYFAWSEGYLPLPGLSPTPHTEHLSTPSSSPDAE